MYTCARERDSTCISVSYNVTATIRSKKQRQRERIGGVENSPKNNVVVLILPSIWTCMAMWVCSSTHIFFNVSEKRVCLKYRSGYSKV